MDLNYGSPTTCECIRYIVFDVLETLYLYGAEINNIDINNVANLGYQVYSTNFYGLSHLYWSTLEFTQLQ